MGYFNINLKNKTMPAAKELLFTTGSLGLKSVIKGTTRSSNRLDERRDTCIDLIFTNSDCIQEAGTLDLNISDHLAVFAHRKKTRVILKKIFFTGRSYRNLVKEDFQRAMIESDWGEFYRTKEPDAAWELMENKIRAELNTICPQRKYKVKETREPWISNELLEEINDKDILLKVAKTSGNKEDWMAAKRARNRVGTLVVNAKAEFLQEQQDVHYGEPKKFWQAVSTVIPSKKVKTSRINLCDEENNSEVRESDVSGYINTFFGNIGPQLAKKLKEEWKFYGERAGDSCNEFRTDYEQVSNLCRQISVTKSSGFEDIASKILKYAFLVLVPQLMYLFNLTFQSSKFPERWKRATIIPLFKGGDRTRVGNYRPVSLLPLPGKLLEKIVHRNMSNFMENNEILTELQHGFRKGLSTVSAVAELTDVFLSAINEGDASVAVFVDLKKAFDTVNHSILLKKLEHYGFRGEVLKWCRDYLTNRTQTTLANNIKSGMIKTTCWVPQCSVLGPLFFIIYVNDMHRAIGRAGLQLYADDTVIHCQGRNVVDIERQVQWKLNKFSKWCRENKLTLNPNKNKLTVFGTRQRVKKFKNLSVFVNGSKIQQEFAE